MVECSTELWFQMVAESILAFPLEGCGLLFGHEAGNRMADLDAERLTQFVPISNAERSPAKYRLDAAEYAEAVGQASDLGLELVGVMHSHPSTVAAPSPVDIEAAGHRLIPPTWHWVVVSLLAGLPDVRSYSIVEGLAARERLLIRNTRR